MKKLTFCSLTVPGEAEKEVLLLVASIRTFCGTLSDAPVWIFVPESAGKLSEETADILIRQQAEVKYFKADQELLYFPFAAKIAACAEAERQAVNRSERLVFIDRDTLFLNEPAEMIILPEKVMGFRPVHHRLIGVEWGSGLDDFWSMICSGCRISEEHFFQMVTHTGEEIAAYFNAGFFIFRPEYGLMTRWQETFLELYKDSGFEQWYKRDPLYKIFMHQAVFTGVILRELKHTQLQLLSEVYNYPLHLHSELPKTKKAALLDDLTAARFEGIFTNGQWKRLPVSDKLGTWLMNQSIISGA